MIILTIRQTRCYTTFVLFFKYKNSQTLMCCGILNDHYFTLTNACASERMLQNRSIFAKLWNMATYMEHQVYSRQYQTK